MYNARKSFVVPIEEGTTWAPEEIETQRKREESWLHRESIPGRPGCNFPLYRMSSKGSEEESEKVEFCVSLLHVVLLPRMLELRPSSKVGTAIGYWLGLISRPVGARIFTSPYRQGRPPLWPSGQSSWLQIQRSWFDSRRYHIL
jgi:hypothetical protein